MGTEDRIRRQLMGFVSDGADVDPIGEAILVNDLMRTHALAGHFKDVDITALVAWVRVNVPKAARGDRRAVQKWISHSGRRGLALG